jgi:hypothetical protein
MKPRFVLAPQISTVGLVAYYKLWTGDAFDYSLTAMSGTLTGTTLQTAGLLFNGSTDKIAVVDGGTLAFEAGTLDFSIVLWVKRTSAVTAIESVMDKRDGDNDGWRVVIVNDNIWLQVDTIDTQSSGESLNDTNWHHAVGVIDRDGNGQMYVDGSASGNAQAISSEAMSITTGLTIGLDVVGANHFAGTIGEIQIYNRTLSASEIKSIYEITRGRYDA